MKKTFFALALLVGAVAAQPVLAQVGTSNGSGSGFLNNDISVGRGGTPGPAELNMRLGGIHYGAPYRTGFGVSSVTGTVLTQPAVIGDSCGTVITQPAIMDSCNVAPSCGAVITQPAVVDTCAVAPACGVMTQPVVISQPAVCPDVCPPSSNIIVPGFTAPTLVDF